MFEKKKTVTEHVAFIQGQKIPYRATFETFQICDMFGNPELITSTFSYERTDVTDTANRPVMLAFNGGPGAASVPVHIGLLGPRRMDMSDITNRNFMPPYTMENNPESILDICDLVIYDMPMCGFSRVLNPESRTKYFATEKDADATILTLRKWLTAHNRWNSPLFLLGESYGSIRNAEIADRLAFGVDMDHGCCMLHLAGIIMLGTTINEKQEPYPIPAEILNFIPIAAANWKYRLEGKPDLEDFLEEAYNFSYEEYLPALAWGNRLSEERRCAVVERLNYFTGLSKETLTASNLKIDPFQFAATGFADLGFSIGINDIRFTGPVDRAAGTCVEDFFEKDVSNNLPMQMQARCFNDYLRNELKVDIDEEYEQLCFNPDITWNYSVQRSPGECLRLAMLRNPQMRIMFCMGYYDLLTPISYAKYCAAYHELPPERLDWKCYKAGHMPYLGTDNSNEVLRGLREFVLKCLKS